MNRLTIESWNRNSVSHQGGWHGWDALRGARGHLSVAQADHINYDCSLVTALRAQIRASVVCRAAVHEASHAASKITVTTQSGPARDSTRA